MQRLAQLDDMAVLRTCDGLIVAAQGLAHQPLSDGGLVLGGLFRRGEPRKADALDPGEQTAIVASRGQKLIDNYWGSYLAVLDHEQSRIDIVRAPWGDLPCYRIEQDDAVILASDIDLLIGCTGYRPGVNWHEILGQLVHGPLHHTATCLKGIQQLPSGERWSFTANREERDVLWSPWTFAAPQRQLGQPDEAANLLRTTAMIAIEAQASLFDRVLATLSGGLDSSILTACLAQQATPFDAMNLVTRDVTGDESHYARRVSKDLGFALTEKLRDVSRVDLRRSGAPGRPYPCVRAFFVESMRLAAEVADVTGAQAVFNGGGGDNIFCSLQSAGPAADRLLTEGLGRGFLRTTSDISQLTAASMPTVLRDALARAWFGKPPFRHRRRLSLLTPAASERVPAVPEHPWACVPDGMLPGKALHVWALAHCRTYVESLDAEMKLPIVAPLLCQPMIEACLSIPTWMWFDGGQNRVAARRAFVGLLPHEILARRSKGTPGSFFIEIFESHRGTIREMLCDGELARQGLIDLPGALAVIDSPHPPSYDEVERILDFIDVEAWGASWSTGSL